jgi:glycosyltransferase involved in cell wall biosynthesis
MRILHLYSGNLYGGIEKVLVTLAAERERCPEMLPAFALCFEGRLADELRAAGASVHLLGNVRLSRPWTTLSARRRLKRLFDASPDFDVVITHSTWAHAVLAPVIRRVGTPLCFWAHDAYKSLNQIDRIAGRTKPDRVIANSQFTLGTVPMLFPNVPGEVLYYPLPLPPPMDRQATRRELRQSLGCAPQTTVIFMGARLEPYKGHKLLLEGLALLKQPDWEAWIAGGPQRPREIRYYAELKSMAQRLGIGDRIRWLGQRNDIPHLLAAADIHCQPNTGPEPFGIVFIEAMQAGLPVVTTRLGAASEIIDQSCGVLTVPGDCRSLGTALESVMDPAARASLASGPSRAKALCDASQQLTSLSRLLVQTSRRQDVSPQPAVDRQTGAAL